MPPTNKAKKSGLTLPGYRYLGPFNSLFSGKPVNKADEAARKHDLGYSDLLSQGENPYLYFNEHDVNLIEDLRGDNTFGGILARSVFQIKQAVAPALPGTSKGGGPKSDRAAKRKLYFARSNRGAKQQKMESADTANEPNIEATEQPVLNAGNGGRGSMGGGGKGGAGVGYSTGGWTGGSIFTDELVITKNTRQFLCDIQNGHRYKMETLNTAASAAPQVAVTTPWSYFNFNQYSSHFSPRDWQHLINTYERFRPAAMRVRIYNLQIKQVVQQEGTNLYNNDLTAGLHVMCDGEHAYPYVQHPWDDNCMPEMPNEIWKLSQYAYLQAPNQNIDTSSTNAAEMEFRRGMPLYILENTDHQVLRTGEATEFTFKFSCEWVENNISYILPQMMYNPKVDSRLIIKKGDNTAVNVPAAIKPSNWYAGPGIRNGNIENTLETTPAGPIFTRADTNNINDNNATLQDAYGTWPTMGALAAGNTQRNIHFRTGEGTTGTEPTLWYKDRHTCTREYYVNKATNNTGTTQQIDEWWMLPNQIWDSHPICRYNSIWMKIPRTNRKTLLDPQDGTIPMEHPPGTIFMKLAKIPIPETGDSYLTIYATGQVSCEIAWEAKKRGTKNWRPEFYHSAIGMNASAYTFDQNGQYTSAVEPADTMQTRYGHAKVL